MRKRILILDDDRDFACTMAKQLENWNNESGQGGEMDVDLATSSVEATMMVNLNPPDLICLDIDLSHESGLAFCEYMAWNSELCKTPIVAMTRRDDLESIRRSSALDLHFVDKSIQSWDEFLNRICDLIPTTHGTHRKPGQLPVRHELPAKHIDMRLSGPFV